jgi:hypothetical protein
LQGLADLALIYVEFLLILRALSCKNNVSGHGNRFRSGVKVCTMMP